MKQFSIILICYIISAISLALTLLFRLVWNVHSVRSIAFCAFGLSLLVGTVLLFGRRRRR